MNNLDAEPETDQRGPAGLSRRRARRDAMVILYQKDISASSVDELFAGLKREAGHEPDEFTRQEVAGVLASQSDLDHVIDAASQGWPAHRLGALERSILRMAVYEILDRADIPAEVSASEAVILAKRFCSQEAGSLINGILGKIVREASKNG